MGRLGGAGRGRLVLLGLAGFLTAYGAHLVVVNLPAYCRQHGLGYGALGMLLAAYNLAELGMKPLAGRLSDRWGARLVMLWGTGLFSLACLAYLVIPPHGLAGLRVCQGLGAGALSVASLALVAADHRRELGRAFGAYNALKGLGYVAAPLSAGLLGLAGDFRAAFLSAGALGLAILGLQTLAWRSLKDPGLPEEQTRAASAGRRWPWLLANFADMALLGVVLGFLPVRADALGYEKGAIGALLAVSMSAFLLVQPLAGGLADRLGRRRLIVAGLFLAAAATALLGLARGVALGSAALIAGLSIGAAWTNSLAKVGEQAGRGRLGRDLGLAGSCKDLGDIAGPLLFGWLAARHGLPWAFALCGGGALLLAFAVTIATKRSPPPQRDPFGRE